MNQKHKFILLTASVVSGFVLLTGLVYWKILSPILSKHQQITLQKQELEQAGFGNGKAPLLSRDATEQHQQKAVQEQWQKVKSRLNTFSSYFAENQDAQAMEYLSRVAAERGKLYQLARQSGLSIPPDLGMPDAARSGDDTATLLMQLKVISTIVELAAQQRLSGRISAIEPLPPVSQTLKNTSAPYFKEFPVRLEMEAEMDQLLRFIHSASTNENLLAVRGLRIEKKVPDDNSRQFLNEDNPKLRAVVVLDALVVLKDVEKITDTAPVPAPAAPRNLQPQGY